MSVRGRKNAGFTLVETVVALVIFTVIGYALTGAVGMAHRSQNAVVRGASSNRQLRDCRRLLADELSMASDADIVVTTLPGGNHEVDFMLPIEIGGNVAWGVSDAMLGTNENWRVRYTVQAVPAGQGLMRQLLRQMINETGDVVATDVIARGLQDGQQASPGFSVVRSGDVWDVTISIAPHAAAAHGEEMEFHVRTRN